MVARQEVDILFVLVLMVFSILISHSHLVTIFSHFWDVWRLPYNLLPTFLHLYGEIMFQLRIPGKISFDPTEIDILRKYISECHLVVLKLVFWYRKIGTTIPFRKKSKDQESLEAQNEKSTEKDSIYKIIFTEVE